MRKALVKYRIYFYSIILIAVTSVVSINAMVYHQYKQSSEQQIEENSEGTNPTEILRKGKEALTVVFYLF